MTTRTREGRYPPFDLREPYTSRYPVAAHDHLAYSDACGEALERFIEAIMEPLRPTRDDLAHLLRIAERSTEDLFTEYGEFYGGGCCSGHDPGEDYLDGIAPAVADRLLGGTKGDEEIVTRLVEARGEGNISPVTAVLDAFVMWVCNEIRAHAMRGRASSLWKRDIVNGFYDDVRDRFAQALTDAVYDVFPLGK